MNRIVCLILATLLVSSVVLADDSELEPLSFKFLAGVGMNTGVQNAYDYLSTSGVVSGDIHYRLNKNVSLVPASVSFFFYSGSPRGASSGNYPFYDSYQENRVSGARLGSTNYVDPWHTPLFQNPYYYGGGYYPGYSQSPPNLAWGVSLTPGLKFQTTGSSLFNFYGQVGAGFYRHNQKSSSYYEVGRLSHTSFAANAETGIEIIVLEHVNLLAGGGYMWLNNNPAFDGIVHLNMGVRVGF